ncbi:hypothetical protein F5Y18DRAFT_156618 [Xylariaceae sp. FL1019]|nr:hypothetical protein F5Y18DRAFT_156618 [Xylariaceae sp. FL1019]
MRSWRRKLDRPGHAVGCFPLGGGLPPIAPSLHSRTARASAAASLVAFALPALPSLCLLSHPRAFFSLSLTLSPHIRMCPHPHHILTSSLTSPVLFISSHTFLPSLLQLTPTLPLDLHQNYHLHQPHLYSISPTHPPTRLPASTCHLYHPLQSRTWFLLSPISSLLIPLHFRVLFSAAYLDQLPLGPSSISC